MPFSPSSLSFFKKNWKYRVGFVHSSSVPWHWAEATKFSFFCFNFASWLHWYLLASRHFFLKTLHSSAVHLFSAKIYKLRHFVSYKESYLRWAERRRGFEVHFFWFCAQFSFLFCLPIFKVKLGHFCSPIIWTRD